MLIRSASANRILFLLSIAKTPYDNKISVRLTGSDFCCTGSPYKPAGIISHIKCFCNAFDLPYNFPYPPPQFVTKCKNSRFFAFRHRLFLPFCDELHKIVISSFFSERKIDFLTHVLKKKFIVFSSIRLPRSYTERKKNEPGSSPSSFAAIASYRFHLNRSGRFVHSKTKGVFAFVQNQRFTAVTKFCRNTGRDPHANTNPIFFPTYPNENIARGDLPLALYNS